MRGVLTRKSHRWALFALVAMLLGCSAFADELSNDPQAKIRPPVGAQTSQPEPIIPEPDDVTARTLFEAFRIWLSLQHILSPFG